MTFLEKTILVDTNVIVAAWNEREVHHKRAKQILANKQTVLSDHVLTEIAHVVTRRQSKEQALRVIEELLRGGASIWCVQEGELRRGIELYAKQRDLSIVDATNLAVMESLGIRRIATFDKAFTAIKSIEVVS